MSISRMIEMRTDVVNVNGKSIEFTYDCEVTLDSVPAPFQYPEGVDAIGVTPTQCTFAKDLGWVALEATPLTEKSRPTKAEFLLAFAAQSSDERIAQVMDSLPGLTAEVRAYRTEHARSGFEMTNLECPACGCHPLGFVVRDDVWESAGLQTGARMAGWWCLDCFEGTLGRFVRADDLGPWPMSDWLAVALGAGLEV